MNKKSILIVVIAAITLVIFTMTSFAEEYPKGGFSGKPGTSCYPGQGRQPAGQWNARPNRSDEFRDMMNLDLSQEQVAEIRQMMLDFQKETLELRNQIQVKQLELKELRLAAEVDMEQVRSKLEEIADLQVELRMKAIEKQNKVKELLTPEQLENFSLGIPMQRFGMGGHNFNQDYKGNCL
ncbi:MAG: Spy/CpxP family protein refolding chaperone [Atribacterota bacterium]|nr:Spy/CpxP family protein refolding chaperone [Atribacterota bacterium]